MVQELYSAWILIWRADAGLLTIISLSLQVSISALVVGTLLGLPFGAWLAVNEFRTRHACIIVLNTLMGLPSVVVGVFIYLMLSRSGPFGQWGLLFSPAAMIIAQSTLITPLIAAISRQIVEERWHILAEELTIFRITSWRRLWLLICDCRFALLVGVLAGLGRAMSEVGAVMIVGGNIEGYTRTMTTAIALETSKGDLPLSMALGVVLLSLILSINSITWWLRQQAITRRMEIIAN